MAEALSMIYGDDAPITPLQGKTVAILGYGSQGHAHAQNLRESGVKVIVANRRDSSNGKLAVEHGFEPMSVEDAVKAADLIIVTLPDEVQPEVYNKSIKPHLVKGKTLGVTHGFNVHFKTIEIPSDIDVVLVAPKGPGHLVRSEFVKGGGVPCLAAVSQDVTGKAWATALAWANGVGGARSGIIKTTFKDECETDLFGEQAVLCGGLSALIKAGFETLTEAGYPPEMAYFECVHEVKLIVDLIYAGGLDYMRYSISNTAEWGDLKTGPRIVTEETKKEMKKILTEIQDGTFAKGWRAEYEGGMKNFKRLYEADNNHPVEVTGRRLRKMMTWLGAKRAAEGVRLRPDSGATYFVTKALVMTIDEIGVIAAAATTKLRLDGAELTDDYYYRSLPLCVIDAVYSIGVRYEGVRRVVARYCERTNQLPARPEKQSLPSRNDQESISQLCARFEQLGLDGVVENLFQNRQRTSATNGILKADAVYRFASCLKSHHVEHLQDVSKASNDPEIECKIRSIPGQRSGISLSYFWMLAGNDDFIKPDRMILRFLEQALARRVEIQEAQGLLTRTTAQLKAIYPQLTPRLLDYLIWQYQRSQKSTSLRAVEFKC